MEPTLNPENAETRIARILNSDERLLQAVLDQMPSGVIVTEAPGGGVLFHNQEATNILKHPLIDTADTSDYARYGGIHEDGTPYRAEEYPSYRALMGETVYQEEVLYRRGDGEVIVLLTNAAPVKMQDGEVIGTVISFNDVTGLKRATEALRESEERFRAMADNLPLIVWMHDTEGEQEFVNRTFCEFFGVTREQMVADRWQILMHPESAEAYTRGFLAAVRERREFSAEVRVKRADGEWRWIRSWAKPRFGFNKEYLGHVGTSADITEQKEAEAILLRSRKELEQQVSERTKELDALASRLRSFSGQLATAEHRERKRLVAMLHDELQQYLVAAKFKLFRAESRWGSEEGLAVLQEAVSLLDDALGSSRNLTQELRPPVLYERGLVPAASRLSREMGSRHGVSVKVRATDRELNLDDDTKAFLYSCVQELLFNAVKHAGVRELELLIEKRDGNLEIIVSDEGVGFEVDRRRETAGGMGLFSVAERIAALGGTMEVDSAPQKGTRITLTVPLDDGQPEESGTAHVPGYATTEEPDGVPKTESDPLRVLLVDDHVVARMGVATLLQEDPRIAVVGEAADGVEAMEHIEREQPDVVLMDIDMPRMNGIDTARLIRKHWPSVRVVGLSVEDDESTVSSMIQAGASAFVSKSESGREIRSTLFEVVGKGNTNRQ
jgi:PAS domain S-box-containing protein